MSLYKIRKLNSLELGALNGVIFGVLLEIAWHSLYLYEIYRTAQTPLPPDVHIQMAPYPFNWWTLPTLFLVTVSIASFLVHRYLSRHIKSSILLWQITGFVAIIACCLSSFVNIWYLWRTHPDLAGISFPMESFQSDIKMFLVLLPLLLVFNIVFVAVLRWRKLSPLI